ncbi:MAG: RNA polymerase sigma factor [Candidatus Limnocylindria bacterium]
MLRAVSGKLSIPATALRIREGDLEDALPRVFRALVAMGARLDEAEDAVQDAAVRALGSPRVIERIDGWLFVVALRIWRARRMRERLLRPLEWFRGSASGPDPLGVTLLGELARLPERQRQVMVARYVLGLSQKETAAALGIAQGTVTATQVQATRRLRARLEDDDER